MLHNLTGLILTSRSVAALESALAGLHMGPVGVTSAVVTVSGRASNSRTLIQFEAKVDAAGVARRA